MGPYFGISLVSQPTIFQSLIWGLLIVSIVIGLFFVIKDTITGIYNTIKNIAGSS